MRAWFLGGLAVVVLALGTMAAFSRIGHAQDGEEKMRLSPDEFRVRFWYYLNDGENSYKKWTSMPGRNGFFDGDPPHGEKVKVYGNKLAAFSSDTLPFGSIVVQESYSTDDKLQSVDVMYRVKGYNPPHNDWYWVKFEPDGRVIRTNTNQGPKPLAGRVKSCIDCHADAEGDDYVHVNDAR